MFNLFGSKKKPKPIEVTDQNFNDLVFNAEKPVVLDFYASWCQPCHVMISLINRLAKEDEITEKVVIAKTDIDANPALAKHFGIRSVPTLLYIKDNKVIEKQVGLLPYPNLIKKVNTFVESNNIN